MIRRHTDSSTLGFGLRRLALRNDHLMLFAQRIVPLQRPEDPEGYELLLRSRQVPEENHAPADLLSAAHRHQLAPAVDMWVAEHALAQAAPHRSRPRPPTFERVIVHEHHRPLPDQRDVSRAPPRVDWPLPESRLADYVRDLATVAVLSLAEAVTFIRELRAMGCRFALDDFGTGTNSLKNLTSTVWSRVKIRTVLSPTFSPTSSRLPRFVRSSVSRRIWASASSCAEYAENARIIQRLRELGVQYAQGYGVEKPRAFAEVLSELSTRESQKILALSLKI